VASGDIQTLAWLINRLWRCDLPDLLRRGLYREQLWRHMARIGHGSVLIVSVIAASAGVILALQAAQQLEKVGALSYVANLVGVTIIRELGPLLTAIALAGRSGAAFASEIATMQIKEEIDALEVMGIEPVRFLVLPRLVASVVMLPCLTLWADFVGIVSGGVFSTAALGLSGIVYFEQTVGFLVQRDVYAGMVKSAGFAAAIAIIGCWQGFLAREGASDVGLRTTSSVVKTVLAIILLDLFFTTLHYLFR
jgi:phospholipid/cholesterol/gamma-HCH transport system permease protein